MHRRGRGIGGISKQRETLAKFRLKGNEFASQEIALLNRLIEAFKANLQEFARKHKNEIQKNPQLRHHFQEMCANIGVDPIASSKGFWSEFLGFGDFYFELAVQIIEISLFTKSKNAGIISIDELKERLNQASAQQSSRQKDVTISSHDILKAIEKIAIFEDGFVVKSVKGKSFLYSVPGELTTDHIDVFELARCLGLGYVTYDLIQKHRQWTEERIERTIEMLIREEYVWIDCVCDEAQGQSSTTNLIKISKHDHFDFYWFPALFQQSSSS